MSWTAAIILLVVLLVFDYRIRKLERKTCERSADGYCARCHERMYP